MGYRKPKKVYNITWDEGELAGLNFRATGMTVAKMLSFGKAVSGDTSSFGGSMSSMEPLLAQFADALIEWNLEDEDGQPVPATLAGIHGQDMELITTIFWRWMTSIAGVDNPLPGTSNSGETSPDQSTLGLGDASQSQPS